jgi:hypothetical protein
LITCGLQKSPGLKRLQQQQEKNEKNFVSLEEMKKSLAACETKIRAKRELILQEENNLKKMKAELIQAYLDVSQAIARYV